MRTKLQNLIEELTRASKRFEEIVREKKNEIVRDSAIQRFEFTYELAWKTLKAALEEKGVKELYSPRDVFKAAFQNGIIENDPTWLDMIDTRNMTSHLYKESMADDVYVKLPGYLKLFKKLVKKLE